jgi:uncharacterized protein YcbK (DUF882 family)
MKEVEVNKQAKLSEHFTLGEMTKTSYHPQDGNIPSRVHIENLINLCVNWLEELRSRYNLLYGQRKVTREGVSQESPIVINSGFRSPEVNQKCGGAKNSNHLTGCAVDIHCAGKEQAIRYACILLDIADGKKLDFDELILEKRGTTIWVHFAVRPKGNRRYVDF